MSQVNIDKATVAPLLAELLGTGIVAMMVLILADTTGVAYFIGTSVAVTLGVVYMVFGNVSGGHFNPAVTFGLWTAKKIDTVKGICYIVAQLLGGLGAWQLYQYFVNRHLPAKHVAYSTPIMIAELVGTAILVFGFASIVGRGLSALESALTYGASFFVGMMIAATASTGYLNPATALAARSFNWVYIVGPLAGGLIGANLYTYLFATTKKK